MSRNVEAIAAILRGIDGLEGIYIENEGGDVMHVAATLATRGLLAVDSITDEQAHSLWYRMDAELVRAALRRCATGEAE